MSLYIGDLERREREQFSSEIDKQKREEQESEKTHRHIETHC